MKSFICRVASLIVPVLLLLETTMAFSFTAMAETYNMLAKQAIDKLEAKKDENEPLWISVTGGPGAGKTTVAEAVVTRIKELGVDAISLPMDGYHYTQQHLKKSFPENGMSRRGAPWTFDAEQLYRDLKTGKDTGEANLPGYSREISDPVTDAHRLEKRHSIVVVEGNWLLLGCLENEVGVQGSNLEQAAQDFESPLLLADEIARWKPLVELWDLKWFVEPPGGLDEQKDRLIERSLKTWNAQKTEEWGGGSNREAATRRAEFNDMRNAKLIECCKSHADVVVINR